MCYRPLVLWAFPCYSISEMLSPVLSRLKRQVPGSFLPATRTAHLAGSKHSSPVPSKHRACTPTVPIHYAGVSAAFPPMSHCLEMKGFL